MAQPGRAGGSVAFFFFWSIFLVFFLVKVIKKWLDNFIKKKCGFPFLLFC